MSEREAARDAIAERYRAFAEREADGVSEPYARLARGVARSADALSYLAALPPERRQPNLFFAAIGLVTGAVSAPQSLGKVLGDHGAAIRQVMTTRTTQTNEPARCAVLLPALARIGGPLALLEVGASAGLCLLPDRYGYDYGTRRLSPPGGRQGPVFSCRAGRATPLPERLPDVVWRAGLDLDPLDPSRREDVEWLEALVWPGQEERLQGLRQALALAAADPPRVVRGDLARDLPALAAEAPPHARLVVFHTAVLAYVGDAHVKRRFAEAVREAGAVWIANESPRVLPWIAQNAPEPPARDAFCLSVDGSPVAWTGPHGQWIDWFGNPP